MSDITLSKAVRSNLLHLQNTADLMSKTQERLATGKKVNSALDNPTNFFTASSLNARASDMGALLDSMANGIQTIEAADNGLTSITKTLESMQSTLTQARQDKSFKWASYTVDDSATGNLSFSGGAVGVTPVDVALTEATAGTNTLTYAADATAWAATDEVDFSIDIDGGGAVALTVTQGDVQAVGNGDAVIDSIDELQSIITNVIDAEGTYASGTDYTISNDGTDITITSASTGTGSSVAITGTNADPDAGNLNHAYGIADGAGTAGADSGGDLKTIDALVAEINNDTDLNTAIRASNDDGKLRIENFSTQELDITRPAGVTGADIIGGNTVRAELANQYNELRDQLDKFSDDASFNGVNLLRGDNLQLTFNETGTSEINVQAKDGEAINSANLGIQTSLIASQLDSDTDIEGFIAEIKGALHKVQSQSSSFGSNLSIVENRQEFTKQMINTLDAGASNLTLADSNEEAANLLALQTRQQLSSTALSMASQADQNVLRLFQ